jgi:hypothetical protein
MIFSSAVTLIAARLSFTKLACHSANSLPLVPIISVLSKRMIFYFANLIFYRDDKVQEFHELIQIATK